MLVGDASSCVGAPWLAVSGSEQQGCGRPDYCGGWVVGLLSSRVEIPVLAP